MATALFSTAPSHALLSVGGFLCVQPGSWLQYLNELIQHHYPDFFGNDQIRQAAEIQARENGCVLESLEKYLFKDFGAVIPKDNLFKIYNSQGSGIGPENMLEAFAAVIEPLGFAVESVLAPDPELRAGLGWPDRVYGLEMAEHFHGRPGIGMIHIEEDYSHAFYWPRMDMARFSKPQFRMAVLIQHTDSSTRLGPSVIHGLQAYAQLLAGYAGAAGWAAEGLQVEVEAMQKDLLSYPYPENHLFRTAVEQRLEGILTVLQTVRNEREGSQDSAAEEGLLEAGRMILRAIGEYEGNSLTPGQ
jgi:hypothetical protein